MNLREVLHVVGLTLMGVAAMMLPCLALSLREGLAYGWAAAVALAGTAGVGLWVVTPRRLDLNVREALAAVGLGWLAVGAAGALPFLFTGTTHSVIAALFESVSGFTTTGASVFPDVDGLPKSILLWRGLTQWLGGMGIIVLGVAILPLVGVGGAQLFQAEASGISTERLRPRIAATARLLWVVYAALTGAVALAFVIAGMSVFDALNHAMTALATGGFSTRTASLGAYGPALQWIAVVAMILGAINFTLHYRMLRGRWRAWTDDTEWRWFMAIGGGATAAVLLALLAERTFSSDLVREVTFNVTSIATTTGFATADFGTWPAFCQTLLIGLMFVGGMAGSTAGGLKTVRVVVVLRHTAAEIRRVLHPRALFVTKLGRVLVREEQVVRVFTYLGLYMLTHAAGTVALTALGQDFLTAVSATVACMSSVGPGLGVVGPTGHYGDLGGAAQLVLATVMLLGRLEFYTLLVLLIPESWRRAGGDRVITRRPA